MTRDEILRKASPRPWQRGLWGGDSAQGAANSALCKLAVNSYETREARVASLEAMLRRIAVYAHEPDKWPQEFAEFRPATAAALAAARKVQP